VESAAEAQELDRRIMAAWEGHPNRFVVSSEHEFVQKAARALAVVRAQLPSCCHEPAFAAQDMRPDPASATTAPMQSLNSS
jgi:hypothetical protein